MAKSLGETSKAIYISKDALVRGATISTYLKNFLVRLQEHDDDQVLNCLQEKDYLERERERPRKEKSW